MEGHENNKKNERRVEWRKKDENEKKKDAVG